MMPKVRWEEMFRDEMEAAITRRPVCYLAYGLSEPHGVQNAMGLDGLKAYALVQEAARTHGGVVAPMTWWHVHETPLGEHWLGEAVSPAWREIGATYLTDVPARVFLQQLVYQLRAVEAAGFRAAILVTGHYGGIEVDMKLVAHVYSSRRPLRTAALADWEAIRYRHYRGDHAGPCETAQLWALRPELVDLSRLPGERVEGLLFASPAEEARASSRREGEEIVRSQVETLGRIANHLLREAEHRPRSRWSSLAEADAIWQEVLAAEADWVSSRPPEGFWEYLEQRRTLFPLPA